MNNEPDVAESRRGLLLKELEGEHKKLVKQGKWNVTGRDATLIVGIAASLGTVWLHEVNKESPLILWLPLVATTAQTLTTIMKFPELSRWNFQKAAFVSGLVHRLRYELPEKPTVNNIAAISKEYRQLEQRMPQESIQPQSIGTSHHANH